MKTISAALQQKIAAGVIPTMTGTLTQGNGTALSLTGADFMENTFAFSEATTNEGSFDIGCAIIGSFGFALNNFDGKFNSFDFTNAYIDPVLDYGGGDTLTMKRYYLAKHKTAGKAIRCESYDGMKFLDEYVVNLTYPITCAAAVAQIATECGVTLATVSFPNSTYTLTEEVSEVTARTLLAYIAQVCGCFAIFRNNGLHIEWYPSTASGTVTTTFSAPNISTSDITITGLLVYPYGKTDEPAQIGTDDYMIVIDNNPFITPDNQNAIAANIWSQLNGMTFRAGSVDILSNPALEAGDTVAVTIGGSTITMLFSTVMYKNMLRQRLQCDAVAEEESDMRTGSAITAGDLARILTVNGINADWIKTGSISANRISGGTLSLGGTQDINGNIATYDAGGNEILTITRFGLSSNVPSRYKGDEYGVADPNMGYFEPMITVGNRILPYPDDEKKYLCIGIEGQRSYDSGGGLLQYEEDVLFDLYADVEEDTNDSHIKINFRDTIDFNKTNVGGGGYLKTAVLSIDSSGISMESGKTVDGVDVSEIPCHISTSGSADMNDYRTEGTYYFSSGVTLSNVPNGAVNGWLQVLPSNGSGCKQFWYRFGSNGGTPPTYTDFYERLYTGAEWLAWERIVTDSLLTNRLSSYVPTTRTVNGHALSSNVTVTSSDVGLPLGSNVDGVGHYITSSGYPYIRYRDTDDKGYQLVVNASGIRYQTQANSSASWVTVWGLEANDAEGKTASTVSAANATDTTLCNSGSLATGTYVLIGTASFASNATGRRALFLSTSSTGGVINRWARTTVPPTSGGATQVQVVMLANFTSATTVYLRAYQNSGGALNITDAGIQFIKLH